MKEAKKITDGALLTTIYIVLLMVIVFIPILSTIGLLILPIPFIIYATRYGYQPAMIMFLVALGLSLMFATIVSLPVTLLAGIGGMVIGTSLYYKKKPYEVWAHGTIGNIVAMIIIIIILQFALNINIYHETEMLIEESLSITKKVFEQFSMNEQQLEQFALIEEQMRTFPDLLPASIAITSIFIALGSMWISFKIMNRIKNKNYAFPPFRQFSLPKIIIWIYFVVLLAILFVEQDTTFSIIVLNAVMLLMVLMVIQGLSFVVFYGKHKNFPNSVLVVTIIILAVLLPSLFMIVMQFLGIIDLVLNMKERIENASGK